jgi:hypothetical protein
MVPQPRELPRALVTDSILNERDASKYVHFHLRDTTYINVGLVVIRGSKVKVKSKGSPHYRPWRPIGLREVKGPTFLRQTANRWRQGCQPYAPAALYPQISLFLKIPGTHFC